MHQITPIEQISAELTEIYDILSTSDIPDEITLIIEYGSLVSGYTTRSGKLLADAKYHKNKATAESILKEIGKDIPTMILKMLIEASVKDLSYLVDFAGRINSDCTHKLDWCRTLISTERELIKNKM